MLTTYLQLATAIMLEVIGTTALTASDGFSRPLPTIVMAISYLAAFYFLSLVLKVMPVGVAYAIWSALGIVLISVIGRVAFKQTLDAPAIIGISLIIVGVIIVNVFSKTVAA